MTWYYHANSGAGFSDLQEMVQANSFSSSRYGEFTKQFLNDAVTDVCRRLQVFREDVTCPYDADGLVTQPSPPFFLVEDVWLTDGSGAVTFTARRNMTAGSASAGDGAGPQLEIQVGPVTGSGYVVIQGLRRPEAMTTSDDTTGLGQDLDPAVIAYTKARLFELEDDFDAAERWRGVYERELQTHSQVTHNAAPVVTPGTWYDYDSGWGR